METSGAPNTYGRNENPGDADGYAVKVEHFRHHVDGMISEVHKLDEQLTEIEKFYSNMKKKQENTSKDSCAGKNKDKDKHVPRTKKHQQKVSCRGAAVSKRMQDLMGQFGTILNQIKQHKWAWPFMKPVDAEGLGLHDYYKVIDRPMDFSTIKKKMEAKDGNGYKNIHEICSDVRLVFKNAMKYNDEKSDVYDMAKTLLAKFEEKWLLLLPKVTEEEKRLEEEAQIAMQLDQEAAHAKMVGDLTNELYEVDMHLEHLTEMIAERCRKMSSVDKKKLSFALKKLSHEDIRKALVIVAPYNASFEYTAEALDFHINAQNDLTLWRLKFFIEEALENQSKNSGTIGDGNNENHNTNKRIREICDAIAKTSKKKAKRAKE